MAKLVGKNGEWNLPHVHQWSERARDLRFDNVPLIDKSTKLFMLGACATVWISAGLRRRQFKVTTHPDGHFYNVRSIRQAVELTRGGWPERDAEPIWQVKDGFVDPFAKSYTEILPNEAEVRARRTARDDKARRFMAEADVVLVSPDFVETWASTISGSTYIDIPLPEVFDRVKPRLERLSVGDIKAELRRIIAALRAERPVPIILSAAAIPLHATVTSKDVRMASLDSISRGHAAVSELCDEDPSLHYFPLADIVRTAERPAELTEADGRHYHPAAIEYFTREFLRRFAKPGVEVPELDLSWMSAPGQIADGQSMRTPPPQNGVRLRSELRRAIRGALPVRYLPPGLRRLINLV